MAIITWELVDVVTDDTTITAVVQEVIDGINSKTYSATVPKTDPTPIASLRNSLKTIIKADRARRAAIDNYKSQVDLTNLEDFINAP